MRLFRRFAVLAALAAIGCTPRPVAAQIPTYTTPQTVTAVLAPAGTFCTGSPQIFAQGSIPGFQNIGQTQHYVYFTPASVTTSSVTLEGLDTAGNVYKLAPDQVGSPGNLAVTGSGYFPKIQVVVTCSPNTGSFTLGYTGTSATSNQIAGAYLAAQIEQALATLAPANATLNLPGAASPFGSSQGILYFKYGGAGGPSGSAITIECRDWESGTDYSVQNFTPATVLTLQAFPLAALPCPQYVASYNSGGASAGNFTWWYIFQQSVASPSAFSHITGTTATLVKNGNGVLDNVVIGTGAAGTISFFDLGPAACTGTPATNVVSVITATTTTPPPVPFGAEFLQGICVKASVAMDLTVNYH
jgi:hypothetical protein